LGWFVLLEAKGRGCGFEAASALLEWARNVKRLNTLVSYIDPLHERSRKLAERLGAVLDAMPGDQTQPASFIGASVDLPSRAHGSLKAAQQVGQLNIVRLRTTNSALHVDLGLTTRSAHCRRPTRTSLNAPLQPSTAHFGPNLFDQSCSVSWLI
jgi:hypothetical protein